MEEKIAVVAIIVNDYENVENVNSLLHEYRDNIMGRLGLPIKEKGISVISVVMHASPETINGLSGKLGMLNGVSSKVLTTK
ncbi:MAG: iron-only hydrogenase system regulator [Clostridia bacterium]|nr:iron-only hydrogenase system regulator [Clostridia bacterium]